jgi:hypothetical protein
MNRRLKTLVVLAALAAGPALALAHEGGGHAMGVVESVRPDRIAIKTSDGHVVEFAVTPQTRFTRGNAAVEAKDVRVGARAVVHGARKGDGLTAIQVKLAPVAPVAR